MIHFYYSLYIIIYYQLWNFGIHKISNIFFFFFCFHLQYVSNMIQIPTFEHRTYKWVKFLFAFIGCKKRNKKEGMIQIVIKYIQKYVKCTNMNIGQKRM